MITRSIWFIMVILLAFAGGEIAPVYAQQPLPASTWYAVVHQPETDTLHWINANGEKASMPRPAMNNEAQYLDMRISPDGRTLLMAVQLNSGLQALGIYNLQADIFTQTHIAQPGEIIHLGEQHIFTQNSQFFAVGLYGGNFASPSWRVLLFDTQTGSVSAFIDHTHPEAPVLPLSAPSVQVLDDFYVHFQMIPQMVGGAAIWPAYAWRAFNNDPDTALIVESDYTQSEMDYLPSDGRTALVYTDMAFASAPPNGPMSNFNAIGWSMPASGNTTTTVHTDSTRYHLMARWAKSGEWLLFLSDNAAGNRYWSIVQSSGTPDDNFLIPFSPQITKAYGTADGYLVVTDTHMLIYSNGFNPNTAPNLAQLTAASRVIYVTPVGAMFDLNTVPVRQTVIVTPQNTVIVTPLPTQPAPAVIDCSLVPGQRLVTGSDGRVVLSQGNINIRNAPNGAILTQLSGGTVFTVTGGAVCEAGFYWWQVNAGGQNGWVAEATQSGYLIEPYNGAPPVIPTVATPVAPPETPASQPDEPTSDACHAASAITNLAVAMTAITTRQLNAYNSPGGATMLIVVPEGAVVTIIGGSFCADGMRWWQVTGGAQNGLGEPFEGAYWLPEGRRLQRYLRPS